MIAPGSARSTITSPITSSSATFRTTVPCRWTRSSSRHRSITMAVDGMRVLMTADAVGGVWTYALDLAQALTSRGISTTLATLGPRPREDQVQAACAIDRLTLVTSEFKLEWTDDPWEDVAAAGRWLLE